ncbi:protein kinase-like domain, concanavalin A-like lectin/glucanase domain protein, partial [Tanacetum coccineum]
MATTITEFDHLKIPLEKIIEATNSFDDKNVIGEGGFGKVYKGKLLHSGELINISARRLDRKHGQGDVEFWTEISALSVLRHDNIVSMIGFCDETDEKIIINHHDVKGSLSMFLSDPAFTLYDRLRASVGIAKAIEYIHHVEGRAFSFIHRNINSYTILLDDKWQPKLSGFEFSIKHSLDRKNKAIRAEVIGTKGYIDPTYVKTGTVTHKSDVYSFGIVLFDILCGKNAYIPNEQGNQEFEAPLPEFYNESQTLRDSWEQYGQGRFTKVAYSCLNEEREQRPAINEVIRELTGMKSIVQPDT